MLHPTTNTKIWYTKCFIFIINKNPLNKLTNSKIHKHKKGKDTVDKSNNTALLNERPSKVCNTVFSDIDCLLI